VHEPKAWAPAAAVLTRRPSRSRSSWPQ
jgi:hypothetical protein